MNDTPSSSWKEDDAAKTRAARELNAIARAQADYPQCWLCGQRTRPDKFGLCSKITPDHMAERQRKDTA